jgi:hypothetical protein
MDQLKTVIFKLIVDSGTWAIYIRPSNERKICALMEAKILFSIGTYLDPVQ